MMTSGRLCSAPIVLLALCVLCALAFLASGAAGASKVYRWTDERGKLVIADRPPEDSAIPYDIVDTGGTGLRRVPAAPAEAPATQTAANPQPSAGGEGGDESVGEGLEKDPDICRAARNNLDSLQGLARVRMKGPDGEFYYLTEEDKEREREQARRLIEMHCE